MMGDKREVAKPWCLYGVIDGAIDYCGFGKIVEERGQSVFVTYTEEQEYSPQYSPRMYGVNRIIKRFYTLKEAIEEFCRIGNIEKKEIREWAEHCFPGENIRD